jgi:hypothetical protein
LPSLSKWALTAGGVLVLAALSQVFEFLVDAVHLSAAGLSVFASGRKIGDWETVGSNSTQPIPEVNLRPGMRIAVANGVQIAGRANLGTIAPLGTVGNTPISSSGLALALGIANGQACGNSQERNRMIPRSQ